MKKLLILLLLIPSLSWGVNCNFPITMPTDGSLMTQQEWNGMIRETKNMIKESGMSKSQIIKLLKEEISNIFDNPDSLNEMRKQSEKLCNELGPIEYKSLQSCSTKLFKKSAVQLGFNSSWFLQQEKKYQKLMPKCTSAAKKDSTADFLINNLDAITDALKNQDLSGSYGKDITVTIDNSTLSDENTKDDPFILMCKNAKLKDLDKEVALLCLEKIK